jgi:hypothetical protein
MLGESVNGQFRLWVLKRGKEGKTLNVIPMDVAKEDGVMGGLLGQILPEGENPCSSVDYDASLPCLDLETSCVAPILEGVSPRSWI